MGNYSKKTVGDVFSVVFLAILVFLIVSIIFATPVWLLWNWLMPAIFGVTKITLGQAWGITLLANFLFKPGTTSSK